MAGGLEKGPQGDRFTWPSLKVRARNSCVLLFCLKTKGVSWHICPYHFLERSKSEYLLAITNVSQKLGLDIREVQERQVYELLDFIYSHTCCFQIFLSISSCEFKVDHSSQ